MCPPDGSRRVLVALLAGAWLPACGPEPVGAPAAPTTRIALAPLDQAELPGVELVAEFRAESWMEAGWTVVADSAALDGGEPRALKILSEGPIEVGLPGEFEPGSFNQVAVTLRLPEHRPVHVRLGAPGEGGPLSSGVEARPSRRATLIFDLEQLEWTAGLSPSVSLYFPGQNQAIGVISVALIRRPLVLWLPTPEGGAGLVSLGEESRRASGLLLGRPLAGSFEAQAGTKVQFSHGVPPISERHGGQHFLEVELSDEHGLVRDERIPSGPEWRTSEVRVGELRGRTRVRFELVLQDGDEGLLALGEPLAISGDPAAAGVLLITSDTHRGDHLGALEGGVDVRTPALDALAARGILFTDAISSTNLTRPSHVALMTGTSPRDTGLVNNAERISDAPVTLAEHFRAAGWMTLAAVSAGSLSDQRSGIGQGFDRLFAPDTGIHESAETVDALLAWLDDAEGVPLFVWVHAFDAHTPYIERPDFTAQYYSRERNPRDPALPELEPWQRTSQLGDVRDVDYLLALYRAQVSYLDRQLARLFDHGRLGRAITAFTADHGESLTAHGTWFNHDGLYPDTLHVPLILAWPSGPGGLVERRPVQHLDIGQTLLELAGLPSDDFPGTSLLEIGQVPGPRFALASGGQSAAVFAESWLFTLHLRAHRLADPNAAPIDAHAFELYDLETDPDCLRDLATERPREVAKLRALLVDWLLSAPPEGWNQVGEGTDLEALAELAELGYITASRDSSALRWYDPECRCARCEPFL